MFHRSICKTSKMKIICRSVPCSITLLGVVMVLILLMVHIKYITRSSQVKMEVWNSSLLNPLLEHSEKLRHATIGTHTNSKSNRTENHDQKVHTDVHKLCPSQYQNFTKADLSGYADVPQVSAYSLSNRTMQFNKKVAILTPVSNFALYLVHYFQLLCSLTYPHHLISVVLGEDSSGDDTYRVAESHVQKLGKYFHDIRVVKFNHTMPENPGFGKHDEFFQKKRRGHLAKSRNMLLFEGIRDADIVLWIDTDVLYYPPDIIEHLLGEDKDVLVPSCMYLNQDKQRLDVYDRNSWQETNRSLENLKHFNEDHLKLEGYTETMRHYLPEISTTSHIVPLDGVGGCVLMVRADCHRKGLIFPACVFRNHIETEGLAKMATQMNFGVYGLPKVQVIHW